MKSNLQFSVRTLLLAIFALALAVAASTSAFRAWQVSMGLGTIRTPDKWPTAFTELIGDDRQLAADVALYGLSNFIDHRSIWLIAGDSPLVDKLTIRYALEPTDQQHPLADDLLSSIPGFWPSPDVKSCTWYVSPGFGRQHIEGVDLFLIARDRSSGRAYVLHEWVF